MKKQPILQALVVADHVYRDGTSGKFIVCGIFQTIFFVPNMVVPHPTEPEEPSESEQPKPVVQPKQVSIHQLRRAGSPFAYISLTDLQGEREFELRYVALSDDSVLFATRFPLRSDDPIATVEFGVELPPLPLAGNAEGTYALELLCENTLLGSFRIHARPQPEVRQES